MIVRSLVGIGILTYPYEIQQFGVLGSALLLPLFGLVIIYCLDLMVQVADDIDFQGAYLERLIHKTLGPRFALATNIFNIVLLMGVSFGNVIFSMGFFNFAVCNINPNMALCGNKYLLHGIAYLFSLPLSLISKIGYYFYPSTLSIIFITTTSK